MSTTDIPTPTPASGPVGGPDAVSAFSERVFDAVAGALEVQAAFLGHRLGWYDALAAAGPLTAGELATRTGTDERYAREWLEHQTVAGYLGVDDPTAAPSKRRFHLPAAHAEVLTDRDSLAYTLPLARLAAAVGRNLDAVVEAYRTGGGVCWSRHGAEAREAQADGNRPLYLHVLAQEYLASIPAVDAALRRGGSVADIGCGDGWASIGVALAHPGVRVDGFDIDEGSVDAARANAAAHGVADRVAFHLLDPARGVDPAIAPNGGYDLVMALECVHDMADPVSVLATMRELAAPDGTVLVMDERVGEEFAGVPDPLEAMMYGWSLVCCLPDGRCHGGRSEATGTVMRPSTLDSYARRAGFAGLEIVPIENDFFRLYRLETRGPA